MFGRHFLTGFWGPTYEVNVIGNKTLDATENFTGHKKEFKNWNPIYMKWM